jgi:N-acetylglutamate synthase-like GNAT family acetyltransferase
MKIRRAAPEDYRTLQKIDRDAKRASGCPENWIEHVEGELDLSAESIRRNEFYVAEESGEVRGFYSIMSDDRRTIAQLCVAPAYFGTGVGKELFLDAMEKSRSPAN